MAFRRQYTVSRLPLLMFLLLVISACGGSSAFKKGKKFEKLRDYDQALLNYQEAYNKEPQNHEYRLYFERARNQAAIVHLDTGRRLREAGKPEDALAEFRRAAAIDPSNPSATQEIKSTEKILDERRKNLEEEKKKLGEIVERTKVANTIEGVTPLNNAPITLKLTGDMKRAYEAIAKVSGINVIFDSDLGNRLTQQVPVDLNNVTVLEALDLLALQTKTYWAVVKKNTIIVTNDNQQTRQFYEEQIIKTFYLGNSLATADLQEVLNTLRTLLDLRKVGVINSQNAIVIRDTPHKIAMAEKILQSIDKAKPEVLIDVAVLEVGRNYTQTLGVKPPSGIAASNPPGTAGTSMSIKDLARLGSSNFSITLPTASLDYSRSNAKVLQNPSLRASDGKIAKLRIGTQQPVAQGSFQPTFGGTIGGSPVVQFTTINVGVDLDITPRVLLNRDIALTVKVAIKSISGFEVLSGNRYPVLTNRDVEHDIRLKEGESSVIGGIITDSDTIEVSGIPGVSKIPLLHYLFSTETKKRTESEVIIVITPHIVRLPEFEDKDLESLAILGSGTNPRFLGKQIRLGAEDNAPAARGAQAATPSQPVQGPEPAPASIPRVEPAARVTQTQTVPRLVFVKLAPSSPEVSLGSRVTVTTSVENAQDAHTLSCSLSFDPKVLKLVNVQDAGFMGQDGKTINLAPKIENETGGATILLSRPPGSPGVNGNGILVNLVFETIGTGVSPISFMKASIMDAAQANLPTSSSGTQITVK